MVFCMCPVSLRILWHSLHLEGLPRLRRLIFFHSLPVIQTFLLSEKFERKATC